MSNLGDKNRRVEFWKLSGAEDGANEPVADPWVLHKAKWANFKAQRGMGAIRAAASAGGINTPLDRYSVSVDYDTSITVDMQMRDRNGNRFNILSVVHDFADREFTDVVCELGGANG